jgi:ABC-type glycerol-3-phosphate transport system substrate-binding protein
MGGVMSKRVLAAVVVLFAVAGCGGGSEGSAKPSASKQGDSEESKTCFVEVIKAVDLTLRVAQGEPSGSENESQFAEFGVKAQGTPMWDIYKTYSDMGARDLAQGSYATSTDAVAAYAPSVKLECVRAYG